MSDNDFNEGGFLALVRRTLGKVSFLRDALAAYYAMKDPETPVWAKAVIATALAYFVTPLDAIPDITPIIGYADDAGAIATAMEIAAAFITDEHYQMADRWFRHGTRYA